MRQKNSFDYYCIDVSKHKLLSTEEEKTILTEIDYLEKSLINHIFSSPMKNKFTKQLSERIDDFEFENLEKMIRFTDSGRCWLFELTNADLSDLPNWNGKKNWKRILKRDAKIIADKRKQFFNQNLRLVISIVRKIKHFGDKSDLVQEGNLGLMRAIERFDVSMGCRFSTYATWWIRHGVKRYLSDKSRLVRFPVHMFDNIARVNRASLKLTTKLGRKPTDEEISYETGIPNEIVKRTDGYREYLMFSLNAQVKNDNDLTMLDTLTYESDPSTFDDLDVDKVKDEIRNALNKLTPFEAYIIRCRFGLDGNQEKTLKEIGDEKSLSRERIRQLEVSAKQKLKKNIKLFNLM
jgi:RNA polymerase primary sigma factor